MGNSELEVIVSIGKPFLHITVTKHCHSSGPESRVHLLPIFGIIEPCQAEGTLTSAAIIGNHMHCATALHTKDPRACMFACNASRVNTLWGAHCMPGLCDAGKHAGPTHNMSGSTHIDNPNMTMTQYGQGKAQQQGVDRHGQQANE